MTDELTLRQAAALGAEKLAAKKNKAASESRSVAYDMGTHRSMADEAPIGAPMKLPPGYHSPDGGLTIYAPKRNDPAVELILGEHKYSNAPYPNSPDELRLQQKQAEAETAKLRAELDMLKAVISGKGEMPKTEEPEPESKSEPESENEEPTIGELKKQAKALGINTYRMKKPQIAQAIANKQK